MIADGPRTLYFNRESGHLCFELPAEATEVVEGATNEWWFEYPAEEVGAE